MNSTNRVAHAHAIIQGRIAAVVASLPAADRDTKQLPDVSIAVPVDVLVTAREALEGQMPCDAFGLPKGPYTPPADDVREAAQTFAQHIGWSWDSLEPIWQRAFTEAAHKVLARPHGTVTDIEVNAALKSLWDNGYVFQITVGGMRTALEAAREARS